MEEQIVVYIYREFFGKSKIPFSSVKLEAGMLNTLKNSFTKHGGLKSVDIQISETEKWRITYWKNAQSYKEWELDSDLHEYFSFRKKYNQEQEVLVELQGPYKAKEIFSV